MFTSIIGHMCVFVQENLSQQWKWRYHISERETLNETDHQQSLHLLTVVVLWETYLAKVFFSQVILYLNLIIILCVQDNYKIQDIYLKRVYLRDSNATWSVPYYGEYSANQVLFSKTPPSLCKPITQIWLKHILLTVLFMSLFLVRLRYVIMPHHFMSCLLSIQQQSSVYGVRDWRLIMLNREKKTLLWIEGLLEFQRHISKILYCSDKTHCRLNEQKKYL